jgi:hypothetical protein
MVILPSWNYRLTNLALWIDRDTAVDLAESNGIAAVDQLTRWGSRGKPGGRSGHIEDYPGSIQDHPRGLIAAYSSSILSSPLPASPLLPVLSCASLRPAGSFGLASSCQQVPAAVPACGSVWQRDPRGLRKTPVSSRQSRSESVSHRQSPVIL